MIRHADGSVTWTADEERCISVAFSDLYNVVTDMPVGLGDYFGRIGKINIYKAEYLLDSGLWPGVKQFLLDDYGQEAEELYPEFFDVDDETAERLLTYDDDEESYDESEEEEAG